MATKNILAVDYESLTLAERVNAMRDARAAGERFAECRTEAKRVPAHARCEDYRFAILESAHQQDEITESHLLAFTEELREDDKHQPDSDFYTHIRDPRVSAFVQAADTRYAEIAVEINDNESDIESVGQ